MNSFCCDSEIRDMRERMMVMVEVVMEMHWIRVIVADEGSSDENTFSG